MNHPSTLPVLAIVEAIPIAYRLNGLWIQWHGDGTERVRRKGEVIVSVQYGVPGMAFVKEGRGTSIRDASQALLAALAGTEPEPQERRKGQP